MAGLRKRVLKRFDPQKSISSHDVPQPKKSSSRRDVPQPPKSSSSRDVPQPLKSSSSGDIPPPHKSGSSRRVPKPQKSSSSRDIPPPHKSGSSRRVPKRHKSSGSCDIPQPQPHVLHKGQTSFRLQDEELPIDETMQSLSPHLNHVRRFDPQKSICSHDIPQRKKSSLQPPKSSSSNVIPPPHKSVSSCGLSKPSNSRDISPRQPHVLHKRQTSFRLQDEEFPIDETMQSLSPNLSHVRQVRDSSFIMENQGLEEEEDHEINSQQIETDTSDPQQEENVSSTSYGTSVTRKESRALSETRKRRLNKGQFIFEVDECAGRIIGEDSQRFITKGGYVMREYAKFDGTTWRKQPDMLKTDIITKCMENSNYDPNCGLMVRAIQTQLASQHKNKQYRLHVHYKKFATKEEAAKHPPNGIIATDWVKLCEKFASEEFQKVSTTNKRNRSMNEIPPAVGTVSIARIVDMKRRQGEEVSAIEQYKIGHFSKKKNKMVNEKADEIWNELQSEEAASSCSPAEICLKKLRRIPGHIKGRSASTKQILATENLRMELELEKKRSKALEEEVRVIKEEHNYMKEKMDFMMEKVLLLTGLQSQET